MLEEESISSHYSIRIYEPNIGRLGGVDSIGPVDILSIIKWMRPYRIVFSNFCLPAVFIFFAGRLSLPTTSYRGFDPFVWPILVLSIVFTLWNWAQSGWLPRVYAATWSQRGLEVRLFGYAHTFEAGAAVEAKRMLLVAALRSPDGRWYPLPSEVFDRLVERNANTVDVGYKPFDRS